MANVLAVKQRKTYKMVNKKKVAVSAPTAANLAHAAAVTKATYWLNDGSDILTSVNFTTTREVNQAWGDWRQKAIDLYSSNHPKKAKPPSNTTLIEEMMLIIGTDVSAVDEERLINAYISMFEKKYNTKILYWANHNHEGHIDDDGKEQINRHVHIFFSNIDNHGKSVRRQWHRNELSNMQTDIHQVGEKIGLKIERATKNEGQAPKGQGHRAYRAKKQKEAQASQLARQKDLSAANQKLRAELQEQKAERPAYAKLEEKIKKLKAKIKAKDLTIEELNTALTKKEISVPVAENEGLKATIAEQEATLVEKDALIATHETKLNESHQKIEELQESAKIWKPTPKQIANTEFEHQGKTTTSLELITGHVSTIKELRGEVAIALLKSEEQEQKIGKLEGIISDLKSKISDLTLTIKGFISSRLEAVIASTKEVKKERSIEEIEANIDDSIERLEELKSPKNKDLNKLLNDVKSEDYGIKKSNSGENSEATKPKKKIDLQFEENKQNNDNIESDWNFTP